MNLISLLKFRIPSKNDRYTLIYIFFYFLIAMLIDLIGIIDDIFNFYFLVLFILAIPIISGGIYFLFSSILLAYRRQWRRLVSLIFAPIIVWSTLHELSVIGINSDWARLEVTRWYYDEEIAQRRTQNLDTSYLTFPWGNTGGAAAVSITKTLVYDESDKRVFKNIVVEKTENYISHMISVDHLSGHFYLSTEMYQ